MSRATQIRSPGLVVRGPSKKARHGSSSSSTVISPDEEQLQAYRQRYSTAEPYRYAAVGGLLDDELLERVVEESRTYGVRGEEGSLRGWGWEQKETDIYKIQQTPDLSSLDPEHLPDETLAALPEITRLKDALYSKEFRNLIREITGCGPLSGKKTDGSVGLYTQGSHLLLHDDSISTRLVSYILYLPNSPLDAPSSSTANLEPSASVTFLKGWDPAWGGSLELYPVGNGEDVGMPGSTPVGKVDVKWGQIVFFEVQPGRSYHAVDEVIVGDGRQRLGVSGWFHRLEEGEEGYEPFDTDKAKKELSSLAQITSAPTVPFTPYETAPPPGLTPSHISFLANYLAPSYLTTPTLERLSQQFVAASEIVLHNFLHPDLAATLKAEVEAADSSDYARCRLPDHSLSEGDGWSIHGPPSKHRYLSLSPTSASSSTPTIRRILCALLPSEAFRAWLSVVSSLAPVGHRAEARRFRRGLDYTLAAGEEKTGEVSLDVSLGLTWWADVAAESEAEDALAEHGGWDCYLAAPDDSEDPAVYQSTLVKKAESKEDDPAPNGHATQNGAEPELVNGHGRANGLSAELEIDPSQLSPTDFDPDSDDDDDGPLLTHPVSFNKLLLVLRDPGVMRFVKYLSAGAKGSRWDVGGEWEVGVMEEDEGDGEDGEEE